MKLVEVPRSVLERTATIIGPLGASAKALAEADAHDGPVQFFSTRDRTIVVMKLPKEVS